MKDGLSSLPRPARYFPLEKGVYEVAPGLKTFGSSFGNGELEAKIFQLDSSFPAFRASKLKARREKLSRYYLEVNHSERVAEGVNRLIIRRILEENPSHFEFSDIGDGTSRLRCQLTGETLYFDPKLRLSRVERDPGVEAPEPEYVSALDALACQVSEDLNIVTLAEDGRNWLSALHVCSPSHWRPEEKSGRDFIQVHSPVPASEAMLRASKAIVNGMVNKGPYVRFVWGLTTRAEPNHHPDSDVARTRAPLTDIRNGRPAFMWVERQVVWGCPEVQASLFTIRASFNALDEIRDNPVERDLFLKNLLSMSPAIRDYKGIDEAFDDILAWLGEAASMPGITATRPEAAAAVVSGARTDQKKLTWPNS